MNYSEKMDDKIFEFVYVSAMRDATLRGAFSPKKDGIKAEMTDCTKDEFKASTEMLKAFVKDVIKGIFSDSDSYDERFLDVSSQLCDDINNYLKKQGCGCSKFKFGNAQKLINILMKYFYLHSFGNEKEKANFQFCHCPMDKQLLGNVWDNKSKLKEDTIGKKITENTIGKRKKDFVDRSWGKEVFSIKDGKKEFPVRYKAFQKAIKELAEAEGKEKSSLDYDYFNWGKAGTDSKKNQKSSIG